MAYMGVAALQRLLTLARESRDAEHFQRLAFTDVIPAGNNRMAFERDAETVFVPGGTPGNWLVLFELDHLKIINDTIGHQTGDEAIRQAYQCLTEAFTKTGICYRIGGDEFACIVRSPSEEAVGICLKKLDELYVKNRKRFPMTSASPMGKEFLTRKQKIFTHFLCLLTNACTLTKKRSIKFPQYLYK